MVKVSVKWGKNKYDVDIDTNENVETFKCQLFTLTGVPPDRQKIMGVKGGALKDDANWKDIGLKEGQSLMLVGSAEELKVPEKPVVFIEDLPPDEQESAQQIFPPGLINLGNTCYLNSGLQTLHHAVPEFKSALLRYKPSNLSDNNDKVSHYLKDLFGQLNIPQQSVLPEKFVTLFRTVFPQFAQQGEKGHYVQQDAEECWTTLLNTLQKIPKVDNGPPAKSVVDQLFTGELSTTISCIESPEEPPIQKKEVFTKLSCYIQNATLYLLEGLKLSLNEEILKKSEILGHEAKWNKVSKITRLPIYLTVQFVRFFWRTDKNNKAKIVRTVDFPMVLDVEDLLDTELKSQVTEKRKALTEADDEKRKKKDPMEIKEEKQKEKDKAKEKLQELPPETWKNEIAKYDLVAIITHKGRTADSGHYVAWVRETKDMWLKYDDETVTPVNEEEIKKLKGGGDWHMAYLCLYRTRNQLFE